MIGMFAGAAIAFVISWCIHWRGKKSTDKLMAPEYERLRILKEAYEEKDYDKVSRVAFEMMLYYS